MRSLKGNVKVLSGSVLLICCRILLYTLNRFSSPGEIVLAFEKTMEKQTLFINNTMISQKEEERIIMAQRKKLVIYACNKTGPISGKSTEVSGIKANNLSYCMVQKAGCTIYKRQFKFLNGQNKNTGTPLSIGKYEVHFVQGQRYKKFKADDQEFVMKSLRAMTVRNPYTRLWSAYIDKFVLPDFWRTKGKMIIKRIRNKPSAKSLQCGYDVTFPEFVKYVISNGHSMKNINLDNHWLPASDICDPCVFKPDIINKQETFLTDLKYTLRRSNLTRMIETLIAKDPTEYEIKDEIDYNFKIYRLHKKCIDRYGFSKLVWNALTLNGYIPASESFPIDIHDDSLNAASLYELVKGVRERRNMTIKDTKLARKLVLRTADSQIPKKDMQSLRELYKNDFEMFDYDNKPEFL